MTADTPDFERALADLEQLVEQLERGDLPLEEALKRFEQGVALTRRCQEQLKAAALKVEQLVERNGEQSLAPLDAVDDDA